MGIKLDDYLNQIGYDNIRKRVISLAINTFEWENMPESVDLEYLERNLFERGFVVFFKHKTFGYIALKGTGEGQNHYEKPTSWYVHSGLVTQHLQPDECVVIGNTISKYSYKEMLEEATYTIYNLKRAIDVNVEASKTPVILLTDKKTETSIRTIFNKVRNNETFIPVASDGSNIMGNIEAIDMKANMKIAELSKYKTEVWADLLTVFGINNSNIEKAERLIVDEVNANNDLINSYLEVMLTARQKACDEINKKFGLNVSVKIRQSIEPEQEVDVENDNDKDGDDDE